METLTITEFETGQRLDKLLARRFPAKSRAYFQGLIEAGHVQLNGAPPKKRHTPSPGDHISITFAEPPPTALEPENIPLDVLFEDNHLIAINKPAGLVVHPGAGNWTGTFVNALLYHCQHLPENGIRPGIVHRLDKETSGVLLAAKTADAQTQLMALFANREVEKEYLAITLGSPGNVTVDAPIGRHPVHRKKMTVTERGKPAITHFTTERKTERLALVRARPVTGRTHQIRVHLQHHRTPVLGDALYSSTDAPRHMLHAETLRLIHPVTGQRLEFIAEIPQDFAQCAP